MRYKVHLGVGIGSLLLSEGGHHIDEAPVVLNATLSTASLLLLLLLLVNLEGSLGKKQSCIDTVKPTPVIQTLRSHV